MFIDDEELRGIFKTTGEEHLQQMEAGLLELEKHPDDHALLETLLREAHSLKGDANMLGVTDVGNLSHQFEDVLGQIKRSEITLSPDLSDRLYRGLDAMRKLIHAAVTGEPAGVNTFHVMAYLMGATPPQVEEMPAPASQEEPPSNLEGIEEQPEATPEEATIEAFEAHPVAVETPPISQSPAPPLQSATSTSQSQSPTYRIDTIRVETRKLDALMTQAGELTVTKTRIDRRLIDIEEVISLWEDWSRDAFKHRVSIGKVGSRGNQGGAKQFQSFYQLSEDRLEQLGMLLGRLRTFAYEDATRLDTIANELEEGIRTLRLLPLSTIFNLYPRMVRDLARQQGKSVELVIEGGETRVDKRILEEMKDPLMHMIRNAIDHGIESPEEREHMGKSPDARIHLRAYQTANNIVIEVADDGRGLAVESIKQTALKRGICQPEDLASMTSSQIQALIFAPGFSTRTFVTEVSGRGVGLDVVRTNVDRLKGNIQVDSIPAKGTTFRIQLRTTLATAHVLIVAIGGISYALPVEFVETSLPVRSEDIFTVKGRDTILLDRQPVSVVRLANLLELGSSQVSSQNTSLTLPCIVLQVGGERLGLLIDELIDEQDVVLKPQSKLLRRIPNVSGATILGTGEVCMVLNPTDLVKSARKQQGAIVHRAMTQTVSQKHCILLVEDSITIRTQEKRILESAGYEVVTAVDGSDALRKLPTRAFDAVVSDIQMPNLDGLGLTEKIRQHKEYSELPVILVTSLASDEDKRRGAEAGANAYITKGTFDQTVLLDTLKRFV
ncbi:MAG: hybrid sensor histidine kinase/response regulator [Leptolyngbyaceae cyanobacterium bins.59]|nr:hybrid sensor histidine kinase/response regulator [Leptolyngbyaceae cyanobacterium bins.59]